eukprot:13214-Prorocentrum_minimum.AAC.2
MQIYSPSSRRTGPCVAGVVGLEGSGGRTVHRQRFKGGVEGRSQKRLRVVLVHEGVVDGEKAREQYGEPCPPRPPRTSITTSTATPRSPNRRMREHDLRLVGGYNLPGNSC